MIKCLGQTEINNSIEALTKDELIDTDNISKIVSNGTEVAFISNNVVNNYNNSRFDVTDWENDKINDIIMTENLLCTKNSSKDVNCYRKYNKTINKIAAGGEVLCINDDKTLNFICYILNTEV